MLERRGRIAAGLLVLAAACARVNGDAGPPLEYKGAALTRLGDAPDGPSGSVPESVSAGLSPRFARACATRLRDPRNGREFQLVQAKIATLSGNDGTADVTRLDRAVGDYETVASAAPTLATPRLRVDCTTSRAIDWVASGDTATTGP